MDLKESGTTGSGDIALYGILENDLSCCVGYRDILHVRIIPDL